MCHETKNFPSFNVCNIKAIGLEIIFSNGKV